MKPSPTKIIPRKHQQLNLGATKEICSTAGQTCLRSVFIIQQEERQTVQKRSTTGEFQGQKQCWPKRTQSPPHICQKSIPKTSGEIFRGVMRKKGNIWKNMFYVKSGIKTNAEFLKNIIHTVKHAGSVMFWVWTTPRSVLENADGELLLSDSRECVDLLGLSWNIKI